MDVPKFNELYTLILNTCRDGEPRSISRIKEEIRGKNQISEEIYSFRYENNRKIYASRIASAMGQLRKCNLLQQVERAKYRLTDEGKAFLSERIIDDCFVKQWRLLNKSKEARTPEQKEKRHEAFVSVCLAPFEYMLSHSQNERIFGSINRIKAVESDNSCDIEVHMSLITPQMLYTDTEFFLNKENNSNWKKEYRPYYYEYRFQIAETDPVWKQIKTELSITEDLTSRKWFSATLFYGLDNNEGVDGILAFGGSKCKQDRAVLRNVKNLNYDQRSKEQQIILNDIYDVGGINSAGSIKDCFSGTIFDNSVNTSNIKPSFNISIFNGGEGNCIQIVEKDPSAQNPIKMFFDIGAEFGKDTIGIDACDSDYNIISHWHLDHYSLFHEIKDDAFKKKWIIPEITNTIDLVGARLVKYLSEEKIDIYVIPDNPGQLIYSKDWIDPVTNRCEPIFQIWQGKEYATDDYKAKYRDVLNNKSLIIRINNTLLTGDSLYRYWPYKLVTHLNEITQLVVPHHGSTLKKFDKYGDEISKSYEENKDTIRAFIQNAATGLQNCVICFGNDNPYSHPTSDHVSELNSIMQQNSLITATGGSSPIIKTNGVVVMNATIEITA